jgi:hypothetical protein
MTVEGKTAPGEQSSESCLHCESNDLTRKPIDGQENIDVAELGPVYIRYSGRDSR